MTAPTPYDLLPYQSYPYRATHPDRLASSARLFGMSPAPVTRCRVLEIACASGGNLLPMAAALPESTFVGIDLAASAIARGREASAELGLTNIELRHGDVLAAPADDSLGVFDYVIAHGVYSWVPPAAQSAILDVCARRLAPQGVAFVSYNVYPGWHARQAAREMMLHHVAQFDAPEKKHEQARALLEFLVAHARPTDESYRLALANELQILRDKPAWYVLHDHLAEQNSAVYFRQFVDSAAERGLQYLGDAEFATMLPSDFPPEVDATLEAVAPSLVATEQYLDFLRNRVFRQTLLCRAEVHLSRDLQGHQLGEFCVASPALPAGASPELREGVAESFRHPLGPVMHLERAVTKAALVDLGSVWPVAFAFPRLLDRTQARLARGASPAPIARADDAATLGRDLLRCYSQGLVELSLRPPAFEPVPGERPAVWPYARWQGRHAARVTNLRHESVDLDPPTRWLLQQLDGTRDLQALGLLLREAALRGELEPADTADAATHQLEPLLARLGRAALLIA